MSRIVVTIDDDDSDLAQSLIAAMLGMNRIGATITVERDDAPEAAP